MVTWNEGRTGYLTPTKPSQADLDTAHRVLQWLSDHAHFFPEEYGEEAATELAKAANACHVNRDDLVTTAYEQVARDEENKRQASD